MRIIDDPQSGQPPEPAQELHWINRAEARCPQRRRSRSGAPTAKSFEVDEVVAIDSQTNKHMIEDDCADSESPPPQRHQ
ncbi:uncharacterized protein J3R85_000215 [Psidium guajava]|nr:uncharacterized protein J3R85_000215 [Psidium guajava]